RSGLDALQGVGLEHVWTAGPHWSPSPRWSPSPGASYAGLGSDGRQPVAYAGPRPSRRTGDEWKALGIGDRPVVGVLDTGCGDHPWFSYLDRSGNQVHVVDCEKRLDNKPIGFAAVPPADPEVGGDHEAPLQGRIDMASGHGTFICGLIHQLCPDADILAWRAVHSSGFILESDVAEALVAIAELSRRYAAGEPGGQRIDVLNLSMGYYHETSDDALSVGVIRRAIELLARSGVSVVCSAGNSATAREYFPAAAAGKVNAKGVFAPMCAVGALNPNQTSVASFSNTGDWVTHYERGAVIMSTLPAFEGGLLPIARTDSPWGLREELDPDNFTTGVDPSRRSGGFALWSGTSFAAPVLAGRVAAALIDEQAEHGDDLAGRVKRVEQAVATVSKPAP
ncbi:MAG: S8 family peptidase, partial [Nocardioides sp.]